MALPDSVLSNLKWKVGALTLAVFIWFIIQFAISRGVKPSERRLTNLPETTFPGQPVLVLTDPGDPQEYKVSPATVDVTLRSTARALNRLGKTDIKAFVSLPDMTNAVRETRAVLIQTPEGIEVFDVQVRPPNVTVERRTAPK